MTILEPFPPNRDLPEIPNEPDVLEPDEIASEEHQDEEAEKRFADESPTGGLDPTLAALEHQT